MSRIVAIANQKGGVGKTTTAINLAAAIAVAERRTLLIDLDPQGNASSGLGFRCGPDDKQIYGVMLGDYKLRDATRQTMLEYLDLLPAGQDLAGLEPELYELDARARSSRLLQVLVEQVEDYAYVIIDCPPSLGLLTLNALAAADAVLVPVQCEYLSMEGLSGLLDTISRVRGALNPRLRIDGILLTMVDQRTNLSREVEAEVRENSRVPVYRTTVPRNVRLSEAPSHGKPIMLYDVASRGCQSYLALAREFLRHSEEAA